MVVAKAIDQEATLRVRGYDEKRDWSRVEALERRCQVGPSSDRMSIFIDTLGDPICRIRNSPSYIMLVAELGKDLVGVIQGTIKVVAVPRPPPKDKAKAGYILGLRVLPEHRRSGIASALVRSLEQWFVSNHVDFSYMATEETNLASLRLFVERLGYVRFRTPSIVVYSVSSRLGYDRTQSNVEIRRLGTDSAESIYRRFVTGSSDFFPDDIDRILNSRLSLGTWAAHFREDAWQEDGVGSASWRAPGTWAMLSVWDTSRVFKLRLGKAPLWFRLLTRCTRVLNNILPCLGMQGIPDLFSPFGFYFIYGIHGEGRSSGELIRALCRHVQRLAGESEECRAVVTEVVGVAETDETGIQVRRWKPLSCPRDVWCIKSMKPEEEQLLTLGSSTVRPLFVDPREV